MSISKKEFKVNVVELDTWRNIFCVVALNNCEYSPKIHDRKVLSDISVENYQLYSIIKTEKSVVAIKKEQ